MGIVDYYSVSNIGAETRRENAKTKREKNSASMQHIGIFFIFSPNLKQILNLTRI
jgi:hypothetical protein